MICYSIWSDFKMTISDLKSYSVLVWSGCMPVSLLVVGLCSLSDDKVMDWTCLFLCTVNVYKNKTQCYKRCLHGQTTLEKKNIYILNWDTHVIITTLSTWGETCADLLPLQSRRPWFLTFLSWRKLHIHPRVCGPTRTWSWPGTWDWRSRHIPAPSAQVRRSCNTALSPLPETNQNMRSTC